MSQELKKIIQSFKHENDDSHQDILIKSSNKVSKRSSPTRKKSSVKTKSKTTVTDTSKLPDLRPSLSTNLRVLFIGFNPGVQSSIQQHHYAHHSNLFWKLFNQSNLLEKVVTKNEGVNNKYHDDQHLNNLLQNGCTAKDDFELIKYSIGFTDLALRCTATAAELTSEEKLNNIPRLLQEINSSHPRDIVFIGKGIWEVIVRYYSFKLQLKFKLNKDNFNWGKIVIGTDTEYNTIIEQLFSQIPQETSIYVFPSTSGLVASMSFQEKLHLWENLADNI